MKRQQESPILVTGAAGAVGGIGRLLTQLLIARGHKVRAMVRREDERAAALRLLGAEVVQGDLTDLASMHRAIEGCRQIYFGMSVSPTYLEASINTAAVARHHRVDVFVNMSQMTVSQMSITATTDSPQHKQHWLAEQALSWSGLPIVTMRPTVFMEGFFLQLASPGVRASDTLALPFGEGKTSPISSADVARAVAVIFEKPSLHVGRIYDLTGSESSDLYHHASTYSAALGRPIHYRDVPPGAWSEGLRQMRFPEHVVKHLTAMAELTRQGRYDRLTNTYQELTGEAPTSMSDFVRLHAAEFSQREPVHT